MEAELRNALVEDLDQLIRLHDRELDAETLAALRTAAFPGGLALSAADESGETAYANMAAALRENPTLDELAADYAAIYLNNRFGASPYESVWLSDEHLACDRSMFELREIYAAAGWRVGDWRRRFDDHLCCNCSICDGFSPVPRSTRKNWPVSSTSTSATGFRTGDSGYRRTAARGSMRHWPS